MDRAFSIICRLALLLLIYTTAIAAGIIPEKYAFYSAEKLLDLREGYEKTYIFNIFVIVYLLIFEIVCQNIEKLGTKSKKAIKHVSFFLMVIAIYKGGIIGGNPLMFWALSTYLVMYSSGPNKSLKDAP